MKKRSIVIGSGVAGLSAAASLAREGFEVTVFEKNDTPGGRARMFEAEGFTFDMGPSWYWMPDVFESFFSRFGRKVSDYYTLTRLDPSYRIYYGEGDFADVPAGIPALSALFESWEPGSGKALKKFLDEGAYKYALGMNNLVYKPGLSWREFIDRRVVSGVLKLHVFQSLSAYVRKFFRHPKLISLLEFPVLFLGAAPSKTPALYSLMNYADMALGTWYPKGGMYKIIEAMVRLCEELGVTFRYGEGVKKILIEGRQANGVLTDRGSYAADYVVAGADYHHTENELLPPAMRQYPDAYWNSRAMAPSCVLFFIGVNKPVKNLLHHTLFFDQDMDRHIHEIYKKPQWPSSPQFYVCCPSKTDQSVAPQGCENLFVLIPVAPGLTGTDVIIERYYEMVMRRLERLTGESIREHVIYRKNYGPGDFTRDYHAFKGNAYGLANTLMQTANLKPRIQHKKISNLYYAGQLTVPGPGVPPSLISGQVAAATLSAQHHRR